MCVCVTHMCGSGFLSLCGRTIFHIFQNFQIHKMIPLKSNFKLCEINLCILNFSEC